MRSWDSEFEECLSEVVVEVNTLLSANKVRDSFEAESYKNIADVELVIVPRGGQ